MTGKLREYSFQGYKYFFEKQQVKIYVQFSLCDPVNPDLLSAALNTTLEKIPYFKTQLCYDGNELYLAANDRPCVVYHDREKRKIPDETNGYLFYISCEGNTVYSEWFHFIADGRGIFAFLTQLAKEYCALRYHEAFDSAVYLCEPGLTWDEIAPYYKPRHQQSNSTDTNKPELISGESHEIVLHIDKESIIALAQRYGVKPFSLLFTVFCFILKACGQSDSISIGYPVDFRRNVSHPNAFYNCVTMCRYEINGFDKLNFNELAAEIDQRVCSSLCHENIMDAVAQDFGVIHEITKINARENVKKRMYEMYKNICFLHLIFSYVGHFPVSGFQQLCKYLTDVQASGDTDFYPFFIVGASLNGQMILNVKYRYKCEDMPGLIRSVTEGLGIKINSIECIK